MYNHLANGWQLAYMDYLIVLTSDLVHVHVSLKEHIFSAVHNKRSLTAMTVDRNYHSLRLSITRILMNFNEGLKACRELDLFSQ